jgi:DNA primase
MFQPILTPRDIAERYHRCLPEEVRSYLKGRGIPATFIDRQLLGWDGKRITIPVYGRQPGEVLGFRYAKPPDLLDGPPEMESDEKLGPELYGWDTLEREPYRVVICENEFDRLVLEARGFPAVSSTLTAGAFLEEWAEHFREIRHVFICFSRSAASAAAARKVQQVLPSARIAKLPAETGGRGTVTDFFITSEHTELDFKIVLAAAATEGANERPPEVRELRPVDKALRKRAERVTKAVRLHEVVSQFTHLQAGDGHLVGHCPFHDDDSLSLSVYPENDTYICSACGAKGQVVQFLMDKESMTVGQAIEALVRFEFTGELYGTGS